MTRQRMVLLSLVTGALACADAGTAPARHAMPDDAFAARTPSAPSSRYRLRFMTGGGLGEIQSDWFPDTGVVLNTRTPWKSLVVRGVTVDLVNFTHGSWGAGTCATFTSSAAVKRTNWDIEGTDLSFAGRWFGTLDIWQSKGTHLAFDGDRVVDIGGAPAVDPTAGGIHNVVTNGNAAVETSGPNYDWFQLTINNAAMKFGSASTSDGSSNPVGAEVACANFRIEAWKASLVDAGLVPQ